MSDSQLKSHSASSHHVSLDAAIVGAGIAGLAASISLRQVGHNFTIYERSSFKNEVGAAINMPPQATRILQAYGLALPVSAGDDKYDGVRGGQGTILHRTRLINCKSGHSVFEASFDWVERKFGMPFVSFHRADLHSALRSKAEKLGAVVCRGCPVESLDCLQGSVKISGDGNTREHDIVVVADGINSSFVTDIVGHDVLLHRGGRLCFRTLIPIYDGISVALDPATRVVVVTYPCRSGEILNVAIITNPQNDEAIRDDWNSPATIEDALEPLSRFHSSFKALVKCSNSIKVFSLAERKPLPRYVRGRAILIGDAAHPMLPRLAGGGSTSLEDAAALSVVLFNMSDADEDTLLSRLQLWNAIRLPRDATQQIISDAMFDSQPASAMKEEIQPFWNGELPDAILGGWSKATCEFLCGYDVYKETEKAREWTEKRGCRDVGAVPEQLVQHFGRVED